LKDKLKYVITIVLTSALVFGFGAWFLLKEPTKYSESERRTLSLLPEFSLSDVLSGDFMREFEEASPDQFPLRDIFRSIKAYASEYIFNKKDNNKIFLADSHLSKLEYPENPDMIQYAGEKFNYIYNEYLENTDADIYLSVVPDKNCFIAEENGYLALDYDKFAVRVSEQFSVAEYIDVKPLLDKDDYYTTDTHWRQEKIADVAETLCSGMGVRFDGNFRENKLDIPFYGVYYNQSGLNVPYDEIIYLTNDVIDGCKITNYDSGAPADYPMYDMKKAQSADAYEMFLSGTVAISVIENPAAKEKNELILFRDSFGSSIAPLMAGSFSKITLVDIRYIASSYIGNVVDFKNADKVLFLYSTVLLNNSLAMK